MAGASVLRKIAWSGLGTAGLIGSLYFSGNEWAHRVLFMPCLHSLGAERAHKVAVKAAKLGLVPLFFRNDPPELVCQSLILVCSVIMCVYVYCTRAPQPALSACMSLSVTAMLLYVYCCTYS